MVKQSFRSVAMAGVVFACMTAPVAAAEAQSFDEPGFSQDLPPNGASANLVIPAALADGSFATPNIGLSDAAAAWHFRVAMNVAALGCRDEGSAGIVAAYNAMLSNRKSELAVDEHAVSAEFSSSAAGRDAYDNAMTRLYNFFAQPPAQGAFCAAAAQAMAGEASVAPGGLAGYAKAVLPTLDQPFTSFYQAYHAWQMRRVAPRAIVTVAAVAPVPPVVKAALHTPLQLDLSDATGEASQP